MATTPLKEAIVNSGRKQVWLAIQMGVAETQFSRWVRGVSEPTDAQKAEIAKLLSIPKKELF